MLRKDCVNLLNKFDNTQIADQLKILETQPNLLSAGLAKAGDHLTILQKNLELQQEVGIQGHEIEKALSK